MSGELLIPHHIIDQIRSQAVEEAPNEACGYLLGTDGIVTGATRLTNIDASPEHFSLDAAEQFAALKEARARNEQLLAVYHSHPETPARMSDEDIRLAHDPKMIYVIHSLADGRTRGFRVDRDKHVTDVAIDIGRNNG
jgi:[CysO sulfur-carrier protein]-S-L-cysteine hydrolase